MVQEDKDRPAEEKIVNFEIDEVLKLKGLYFKVVLVDAFTGKLGLKRISKDEAAALERGSSKKEKK